MSAHDSQTTDDAEELRTRPTPRTMATACIYDEVDELIERHTNATDPEVLDPIEDRFESIGITLGDRLDVDRPKCPECGERLGQTTEGVVVCDHGHEIGEEARAEYERVTAYLWGQSRADRLMKGEKGYRNESDPSRGVRIIDETEGLRSRPDTTTIALGCLADEIEYMKRRFKQLEWGKDDPLIRTINSRLSQAQTEYVRRTEGVNGE